MHQIILGLHVLIALALIGLVLMQHGKGADAGAAFGSGASATVFGAAGSSNFLSRTTAILATLFFITSLSLGYLFSATKAPSSVTEQIPMSSNEGSKDAVAPKVEVPPLPLDVPATPSDVPAMPADVPAAATEQVPVAPADVPAAVPEAPAEEAPKAPAE